jgi:hypothetical protein
VPGATAVPIHTRSANQKVDKLKHSTPIRARGAEEARARFAQFRAATVAGDLRALAPETLTAAGPVESAERSAVDLRSLAERILAAASDCRVMFPDVAEMAAVAAHVVERMARARLRPVSDRVQRLLLSEAGRLLYLAVIELDPPVGPDVATANLLAALAERDAAPGAVVRCAGPGVGGEASPLAVLADAYELPEVLSAPVGIRDYAAQIALVSVRRAQHPAWSTWGPHSGEPASSVVVDGDGATWRRDTGPGLWRMDGFDPHHHEAKAGEPFTWAELAGEYGPLTEAVRAECAGSGADGQV